MARDFNPIFDRVLIKRANSALQKKTEKAGLIVPDSIKEKYQSSEGVLVKCGDSCDDIVKGLIGKSILFARYSGDDIKIGNDEFVLATDKDIFGELTNE